MNTSEAASASATGAGGSEPSVGRGDMTVSTASAPVRCAAVRSFSPRSCSGSSTTTTTSSLGWTARQRRTTVSTARSRSVIGREYRRPRASGERGDHLAPDQLERLLVREQVVLEHDAVDAGRLVLAQARDEVLRRADDPRLGQRGQVAVDVGGGLVLVPAPLREAPRALAQVGAV